MIDLQENISIDHLAEERANFCRIFSNARRVRILWAIADQELSVGAIAQEVGSSLQNISQHLSAMKALDIVTSRRDGQTIYYTIDRKLMRKRCPYLLRACTYSLDQKNLNPD